VDTITSRQILLDYAMRLACTPYRWGGDDPMAGFDCSGVVLELLAAAGVVSPSFDASSDWLWHNLPGSRGGDPVFGSLIFFGSADRAKHVAWALNAKLMVEAGGGRENTLTVEDAIRQNAWVRVRRISSRVDFLGTVLPDYDWTS